MELIRPEGKTNEGETRRPAENQLRKVSVKYGRDHSGVLRSQLSRFERALSTTAKEAMEATTTTATTDPMLQ